MVLDQIAHTVDDAAAGRSAAQNVQREERNRQTADQQTDAVYRIRYGNCLQTTEDGVNRTDHADGDAEDNDRLELGDAEDFRQAENVLEYERAGVQYDRNLNNECEDDVKNTEPELGAAVKSQTDQLRDGGDAAFEIARRGKQRQHDQRGGRHDLECHRAHADRPGLSVCTDKLLCRKVGQQQRACDNDTRQTAACQKIAVGGGLVIALGLDVGDDRNFNRKKY